MSRSATRFACLILAALALPVPALAVDGEITHLSGAVIARRTDGGSRILTMKSGVGEGDLIITSDASYARIKWSDGAETVLRPSTQLKIDAYKYEEGNPSGDNVVMSLLKGGMRSVSGLLGRRNPGKYGVATPNATIGIRGTHWGMLVCNNDCAGIVAPGGGAPPNGLHVDVADGIIVVTNQAGTQDFRVGEFGYVQSFTTPPATVPASQGVRVVLPAQALNQTILGGKVGAGNNLECQIQ